MLCFSIRLIGAKRNWRSGPVSIWITDDLDEFFVKDEQYILDYDPRVNVLASALWKGQAMPVVWTKGWGQGRVFYLALGHQVNVIRPHEPRTIMQRGLLWAAESKANL